MQRRQSHRELDRHPRGGWAPLELTLAFPTLILMTCLVVWIGGVMNSKIRVTVDARYEGDKRRGDPKSQGTSNPFEFNAAAAGKEKVQQERTFSIFPRVLKSVKPTASYSVLLGSWDHRQLDMRKVPDYPLAFRLAAEGPGGELARRIREAEKLVKDVVKVLDDFQSLLELDPEEIFTGVPSALGKLQDFGFSDNNDPQQQSAANSAEKLFQEQIQRLISQNKQLDQIRDALESIKSSASKAIDDAKQRVKEAEQQIDQIKNLTGDLSKASAQLDGPLGKLRDAAESKTLTKEEKKKAVDAALDELIAAHDGLDGIVAKAGNGNSNVLKKSLSSYAQNNASSLRNNPSQAARDTPREMQKSGFKGAGSQLAKLKPLFHSAIDKQNAQDVSKQVEAASAINNFSKGGVNALSSVGNQMKAQQGKGSSALQKADGLLQK